MLPVSFVMPSSNSLTPEENIKTRKLFHSFSRYDIFSLLNEAHIPRKHSQTKYSKIIRLGDLHYCEGYIEMFLEYNTNSCSTRIYFCYDEERCWSGWCPDINASEIKEFVQSWQNYYATLKDLLAMLRNSGFIVASDD